MSPYLALLQVGFASTRCRHRAWCALTAPFHPCPPPIETGDVGGLLSVALSVASRRLGVTQHLARGSPDFPPRPYRGDHLALLATRIIPRSGLAQPWVPNPKARFRPQSSAPVARTPRATTLSSIPPAPFLTRKGEIEPNTGDTPVSPARGFAPFDMLRAGSLHSPSGARAGVLRTAAHERGFGARPCRGHGCPRVSVSAARPRPRRR